MRGSYDLVCLAHLRWDFVFQRPQHLLTRAAREHRVFYVEEPILDGDGGPARLERRVVDGGVHVCVPHLPAGTSARDAERLQRTLLDELIRTERIERPVLWYLTPMALGFTAHLRPLAVAYDCMDELSGFHGAPPELVAREVALLANADVVFTGGHSLYEHKRDRHRNIHPFPSSVDVAHFASARSIAGEPADQLAIPRPRVGYFGVIDERMDVALVEAIAVARPELQLVLIGPVVKIDPATLPRRRNIHWLGGKSYAELPAYIARWDVAIMPFARNAATRFISPTKTPEFLAAGLPVVSTSIRDVVRPYGDLGLARIADDAEAFVAAIEACLDDDRDEHRAAADRFLADLSWDRTFAGMKALLDEAVERARTTRARRTTGRTPAVPLHGAGGATAVAAGSHAAGVRSREVP